MTPKYCPKRAGFTLVELLVVIAIIAFLAALIIAFFPSISAQSAEANGAANLQGWLNIARQKAIRNQNPYGLRLWVKDPTLFVGSGNPVMTFPTFFVSECQYIEQPDDLTSSQGATISTSGDATNLTAPFTVTFTGLDLTGGFAASNDPTLFAVQPGDYLEVLGTGLMHQVTGVTSTTTLTIATPIPFQLNAATKFRILRQPRVISEETLPLPTGVFIDLNTNTNANISQAIAPANSLPIQLVPAGSTPAKCTGAFVDVLFGPSGALITQGLTQSTMNLWVRQPDSGNPATTNSANIYYGNPTIIAIFAQTGLVGAFPPSLGNPYVDIH